MCGIFGFFSRSPVKPNNLFESLQHRGPDDLGGVSVSVSSSNIRHYTYVESKCDLPGSINTSQETEIPPDVLFLGHRRLSIIDLSSSGHQPMVIDGYCIVFNGEIYNYIELREELVKKGIVFRSHSDTEVLLRCYIVYGEDCIQRFNGMWAFSIWDPKKKKLFLSRDRFGKKPLFYYCDRNHFAFASEIKALLQLPFIQKSPDLDQIKYFITWGSWEHRPETTFKSIRRLLPAHNAWFNLSQNSIETIRYYALVPNLSLEPFSEQKAKQYTEEGEKHFLDAVRIRLRSDVPVGTSFSGGVDSSGIVFAIRKIIEKEILASIGSRQYTFSSVYEKNEWKKHDESKWIDLALKVSNAIGVKTEPRPERLIEEAKQLVYHQDEPFETTSIFAGWCVMSLPRKYGVIVTLDGQGPDESLGGYPPHIPIGFSELLLNFRLLQFLQKLSSFSKIANFSLWKMLRTIIMSSLSSRFRHRIYRKQLGTFFEDGKIPDYEGNSLDSRRFLNEKLKSDVEEGLPRLLRFSDRNAMAFSIESRVPWLDFRLMDFFFSIPSCYKTYRGWTKWIERKLLENFVPEEIIWRKDKLGFPTPEKEWFNDLLHNWLNDIINRSELLRTLKIVRPSVPEELTWRLACIALWEEVFFR